jgi:hypothetical protein
LAPGDTPPTDTAGTRGTGLPEDTAGKSGQVTAPLAFGAQNASSNSHFPTLLFILLVLLTVAVIVAVIARQFSRR